MIFSLPKQKRKHLSKPPSLAEFEHLERLNGFRKSSWSDAKLGSNSRNMDVLENCLEKLKNGR